MKFAMILLALILGAIIWSHVQHDRGCRANGGVPERMFCFAPGTLIEGGE